MDRMTRANVVTQPTNRKTRLGHTLMPSSQTKGSPAPSAKEASMVGLRPDHRKGGEHER